MVQVVSPRMQHHGASRCAPGADAEALRVGRGNAGATSYSYSAVSTPPASGGGSLLAPRPDALRSMQTSSTASIASPRRQAAQFVASPGPPRQNTASTPVKENGFAVAPPAVVTNSAGPIVSTPSVSFTPPVPGLSGLSHKSPAFSQVVYTSPRSRSPSPPLSPGMRAAEALQSSTPTNARQGVLTPQYPSSPPASFGPAGVVRSLSAASPSTNTASAMASTMPPLYGHREQPLDATSPFGKHGEQQLFSSHSQPLDGQWPSVRSAHREQFDQSSWSELPRQHHEHLEQQQWSAAIHNVHREQPERPWAPSNGVHNGQLEQPWEPGNSVLSGPQDQEWGVPVQNMYSEQLEQQTLPPEGPRFQHFESHRSLPHGATVQQLEQQLIDFRALLKQTQERAAALVNERDHRISMLDRLVEDQRHALDAQRRDAEELRSHQQQLVMANREQAQRLSDLEAMFGSRDSSRSLPGRDVLDRKVVDVDRPSSHSMYEGDSRSQSLLGHDRIDQTIQEYLDNFPDFYFFVEKKKPGWYQFGKPISKKVYMKVVGNDIVVRVGGGYKELHKFLDEYRLEWLEGRAMLENLEDMRARQAMKRDMQQSRKML